MSHPVTYVPALSSFPADRQGLAMAFSCYEQAASLVMHDGRLCEMVFFAPTHPEGPATALDLTSPITLRNENNTLLDDDAPSLYADMTLVRPDKISAMLVDEGAISVNLVDSDLRDSLVKEQAAALTVHFVADIERPRGSALNGLALRLTPVYVKNQTIDWTAGDDWPFESPTMKDVIPRAFERIAADAIFVGHDDDAPA